MSSTIERSPELDAQLHAMAMATERSNRPMMLLVIPALLALAALVYLGIGLKQKADGRTVLQRAANYGAELDALIERHEATRSAEIDWGALYPRNPYIGVDIESAMTDAGIEFSRPPSIGQARSANAVMENQIQKTTVQCDVTEEPISDILRWITAVENHENLKGRAFLSSIQMNPRERGWQAKFGVSIYEHR